MSNAQELTPEYLLENWAEFVQFQQKHYQHLFSYNKVPLSKALEIAPPEHKIFQDLQNTTCDTAKVELAYCHNTPPHILANLAESKDEVFLMGVATNRNTPPTALAKLAESENERVLYRLTTNPSTPPETLRQLAKNEKLQDSIACNPSTPEDLLRDWAKDLFLVDSVLVNPNIPLDVLQQLAKHPSSPSIRRLANDKLAKREKTTQNKKEST